MYETFQECSKQKTFIFPKKWKTWKILNAFFIKKTCFATGIGIEHWFQKPISKLGLTISTTPLQQWGFQQCLPFSWTTLWGKHCRHPIAVMWVVDTFGLGFGYRYWNLVLVAHRSAVVAIGDSSRGNCNCTQTTLWVNKTQMDAVLD